MPKKTNAFQWLNFNPLNNHGHATIMAYLITEKLEQDYVDLYENIGAPEEQIDQDHLTQVLQPLKQLGVNYNNLGDFLKFVEKTFPMDSTDLVYKPFYQTYFSLTIK